MKMPTEKRSAKGKGKANLAYRKGFIEAYKRSTPCMDCGATFHHAAMDFDHRPGEEKLNSISQLMSSSLAILEAEIAKCDLVCSNCHRVRTYIRGRQKKAA